MSERRANEHEEEQAADASALESGVLPKGFIEDRVPPWDVVHAYLTRGEHRVWVETFASTSPAFADALAALRNDHEERSEPHGVVVPIRGRRRER
jgi:hypothetical protein